MQGFDKERRAAGRGERRRPAQDGGSAAPVQDEPFPSPQGPGHGGEFSHQNPKNLPEASNPAKMTEPECFIRWRSVTCQVLVWL